MKCQQNLATCVSYSEFHNYLDTVGGVFNPDYTDTSDFAGGLRRFPSHKAALLQCLLEKRLFIFRVHYSIDFAGKKWYN